MDPIKEAFLRIKEDILNLQEELYAIKTDISTLNSKIIQLDSSIQNNQPTIPTIPTHSPTNPSAQTDKQTDNQTTPTHNLPLEPLYPSNSNVSIGNRGVPTDRQTNQQTNQQTDNLSENSPFRPSEPLPELIQSSHNQIPSEQSTYPITPINSETLSDFKKANEILNSLDNVKKAIRLKFKRLTPQEMLVFSTLYSLEEQKIDQITYKLLANNLSLSESSIRDYTNKLIQKGVPIDKIRQNNKTIVLKISSDLKNIANLSTIQTLRKL